MSLSKLYDHCEERPAPANTVPRPLNTPCHIWTGRLNGNYGQTSYKGRTVYVHRLAWELSDREPLSIGMVLDHVCGLKRCFNPDHLDLVTHGENLRREALRGRPVGRRPEHMDRNAIIVAAWARGRTHHQIAEQLGYKVVTPGAVKRIIQQHQARLRFTPRNSLSVPVRDFLQQEVELHPDLSVPCEEAYGEWACWAREQGIDPSTPAAFGRALRQAAIFFGRPLQIRRPRVNGKRERRYGGMGLKYREAAGPTYNKTLCTGPG